MSDTTPLMEQYAALKREHKTAILFFRLGDFYEMFKDDAVEVSALLNLTLTKRHGEPMCGIPYHASRSYIARLLNLGKRIAVCEQVGSPGKGIMERRVVEVVSPGAILDEEFLDRGRNNYIVSVCSFQGGPSGRGASLAAVDVSTGEFTLSAFPLDRDASSLRRELSRLQPSECLVQQSMLDDAGVRSAIEDRTDMVVDRLPDWSFDPGNSASRLKSQLGAASLKGYGLKDDSRELLACGALLDYLEDAARAVLVHIRSVTVSSESDRLSIDESSMRNLELVQNLSDSGVRYTLLEVMDETRTGMGARAMRKRVLSPLKDAPEVQKKLDRVEHFYRDQAGLSRARQALSRILDLERLSSRIALERAHARDLLAVAESIEEALPMFSSLAEKELWTPVLPDADETIRLAELSTMILATIMDEPSILVSDGGIIRDGIDAELDSVRALEKDSRSFLEAYLEDERRASGIQNLKLRRNNIIGFYLEVTKAQLPMVPPHFTRRQGLANGERFTTARLGDLEERIGSAVERAAEIEKRIFLELRTKASSCIPVIAKSASAIAEIDASCALAFAATRRGWTRPVLDGGTGLEIREGRHPIVEAHLPDGAFVPNDIDLAEDGKRFALITGPNMSGKSTFLRQTALIVIMAQAGSFVPARSARIGIADKVFCRVGAQDNLARGESTFLVEMNETAFILNTATERSLVIMDEVGRGTSTTDGLSIAWAVSEKLSGGIRPRTLFATHYHELTSLKGEAVLPLRLDAEEREGKIVFLKKVLPGFAASSYGIQVAALAGLPDDVLKRAECIRADLEGRERVLPAMFDASSGEKSDQVPTLPTAAGASSSNQSLLFDDDETVLSQIREADVDTMTPLEAMTRIAMWKKLLGGN
jgi:DNA mismatch repair protein MutS